MALLSTFQRIQFKLQNNIFYMNFIVKHFNYNWEEY